MKRIDLTLRIILAFLFFGLLFLNLPVTGQEKPNVISAALPADVIQIVSVSCVPCHTSDGGVMSKSKLNLTEWANYSPEKQKEKAAKMYSELSKGAMPPKKAREKSPEKIPTMEQTAVIKKWSESFPSGTK
jgi:mono/diheme cytochrome c family protein